MCCLLLLVSSCKTRKYLQEDESFLKENKIVFENKDDVDNWRNLKYELSTLAYQRPNSKVFWVPRRWFYYKVENPSKRKAERRARKDAKRLVKGKEKNDRRIIRWDKKDDKRLAKEKIKNERRAERLANGIEESERTARREVKKFAKRKERISKRDQRRATKLAEATAPKKRKFNNWVKKSLGEEPAIYDENHSDATAKTMEDYLFDRGYFDGEVEFEPPTPKKFFKTSKVNHSSNPTLLLIKH